MIQFVPHLPVASGVQILFLLLFLNLGLAMPFLGCILKSLGDVLMEWSTCSYGSHGRTDGFAMEEGGKVQEMKCEDNGINKRIKQLGGQIIRMRNAMQIKYQQQ